MTQNSNIKEPNWPKEPDYTSPLPKNTDAGKIPPRTAIKPFAGLPASSQPRPLKVDRSSD